MGWRDDLWSFDLARFTVAGWATFIVAIVAGVALGTAVGLSVHAVIPTGQGRQATRIGRYAGIACAFGFFFAAKGMLKAMGVHIIRPTHANP